MKAFNYLIPTEIIFGEGKISTLHAQIAKYGKKVLLVYSGDVVKITGIYDQIMEIFKEEGVSFWEVGDVAPNPRVESVNKGGALCKEHDIDWILGIGGGSAIDCSKAIAAAAKYEGDDAWDMVMDISLLKDALPIGNISTVAATGSEIDPISGINNDATNEKKGLVHPLLYPKFSIQDPLYTFTVPKYQTAVGTIDMMCHILENYLTMDITEAVAPTYMAEGLLKTIIEMGPVAYNDPKNYKARSNLMWAAGQAMCGLLEVGKVRTRTVHPIEHAVSGMYPSVVHGEGLAILMPRYMEYALSPETAHVLAQYGRNVWGVEGEDNMEVAKAAIETTKEFFASFGVRTRLRDVGVPEEALPEMAKIVIKDVGGVSVKGLHEMFEEDVLKLYQMAW